jgi:hypothetical protein
MNKRSLSIPIVPLIVFSISIFSVVFYACSDMIDRYRIGLCYAHAPTDAGLSSDSADPLEACRALGLSPGDVVSARWVLPDGSDPPAAAFANYHLGHAIKSAFGTNVSPREGDRFLALSTGNAQIAGQTGYGPMPGLVKGYSHSLPSGFPAASTACPTPVTYDLFYDGIALEAVVRVPQRATGFLFDFKLYTSEYPDWKCMKFADHFIMLVSPAPAGSVNSNVCFSSDGPISINTSFITECSACSGGTTELAGTGFEAYGASPWLETMAPVGGGSVITVRFAIWDNSDGACDTVILIDNWRWVTFPVTGPGTNVEGGNCPCR